MGLLDLFRKDEVSGSRVLVCALDPRFEQLVTADYQVYKRFYQSTFSTLFSGVAELTRSFPQRYDIIHFLSDVQPGGVLSDRNGDGTTGAELLRKCCESNVKMLWIASDNQPELYIKGFNARGKRINLVMTIDRGGPNFSTFLDKLLFRMSCGDTMPIAWNDLCPQVPRYSHPDSPSCIFFAGRGGVKLR